MKINVTKPSMPSYKEYCKEIKDLWKNHWLTNSGPKHEDLRLKLSNYLDVQNISLFTNGHLALEYALAVFDFPKGSEVITTPFTFVSTTNAIARNGLVPIFCDVNDRDYTIDVSLIEKLITKKTVAILAVHVYGNVCDVKTIEQIAKKHNLIVIYDAAHAFGVKYNNKSIAAYGDICMFSFHATKVFNTIEGGCLCTKDINIKNKIDSLIHFGITSEDECEYIGGNAKMNEFQASMGLCNLRHIDDYILKRGEAVQEYKNRLQNVPGIKFCDTQKFVSTNYSYLPLLFTDYKYSRDEIKKNLEKYNIGARKYFFPLTSRFECYKYLDAGNTPTASFLADHILCLPLYPDLKRKEINQICDIILK